MTGDEHNYEVVVTYHSYANPTGRCAECGEATPMDPQCCDVPDFVPVDQSCPTGDTCDIRLGYCFRPVGTTGNNCTQEEQFLPSIELDSRSITFSTGFFGARNPITTLGIGPWRVSSIVFCYT